MQIKSAKNMKKVEGTDATMSTNHTFMLTLSNRCSNIQKQNVDQGFTSPIHILSIAKMMIYTIFPLQ